MSLAWSLPAVLVLGWAAMAPSQLPGTASQLPSCQWMRWLPGAPPSPSPWLPPLAHLMSIGSQACACTGTQDWGGLPYLSFTPPAPLVSQGSCEGGLCAPG